MKISTLRIGLIAAAFISSYVFSEGVYSYSGLLANNQVWIGSHCDIKSSIGGGYDVSISRGTVVTGSIYSNSSAYLNTEAQLSGNISGNGTISIGTGVNVGGNIYGGNAWVDQNSTIHGNITSVQSSAPAAYGGVSTGSNVHVGGNVNAGGDIWLNSGTSVAGDASPGVGHSLWTGSGVTIGGSTAPANPTVADVTVPSIPTAQGSVIPGVTDIWVGNGQSSNVATGSYNTIATGAGSSLSLTSGVYNMSSFWMDDGGVITFDTTHGPVFLNVLNSFAAGDNFQFDIIGDGEIILKVYAGDISFGENALVDATMFVYDGDFFTDDGSDIKGSIRAQNIIFDCESKFEYVASGISSVPEPLTVVAIASGVCGLGLYLRKRLREDMGESDPE